MVNLPQTIISLSNRHGFTKSAQYDQGWMFDNSMGPNPLWLIEWLTRDMSLNTDMVVLDMGCGKALTSIFLAKEYGCTVFANDLWIPADENLKRITDAGLEKKVFPIHAEAHTLPYAKGQFDAIISIDSYQYFGTDDMYLDYFLEFLKPGGQLGLVMPGWSQAVEDKKPYWPEAFDPREFACFHTLEWWRAHLSLSGLLETPKYQYLPEVKNVWLDSAQAMYETKKILREAEGAAPEDIKKELEFWRGDIDYLEKDKDNYASILQITSRKKLK